MIKLNLRKKGLMGICLALALCIVGVGAQCLKAAERVDLSKPVKITAEVDNADGSTFATKYQGTVTIKLYKVAKMSETGDLTLAEGFENSGVNLAVLGNKPTVDTIKSEIVSKAVTASANATEVKTLTINRGEGESRAIAPLSEAGLYLYVPEDATDDRYLYEFTPYVILAPESTYITTGEGSDEWNYNVTFKLKASDTPRIGKLKIVKTLKNYNVNLGDASFVYEVKAVLDGKEVINNVYKLDFTAQEFANSHTAERLLDVEFPATAVVTVKETYSGASYKPVDGKDTVTDITIVADETKEAAFENESNGNLIVGGIAAENVFVDDEDGNPVWQDNSPR